MLIPINITLWEKSLNSPAGVLAWDSAPGGFYDLRSFQANIPGNPNINAFPIIDVNFEARLAPQFSFVSTVSALDVTTVNTAALTAQYTGGSSPGNASRFANFITQERRANEFNTEHILFTTRNSNWLFNNMQQTGNQIASCTQFCASTPSITGGSASVCNGFTTTFSISNNSELPATWAVSNNLTVVSQNATSVTVKASSSTVSGNAWIDAIVRNTTGCEAIANRRNIWVGRPSIPAGLTIEADRNLCANQVAEFYVYNSNSSITNYVWGFYGASILSGQGSSRVVTRINSTSSVSVDLELGNACGNTTSAVTADFDVNCNNLTILIYPNPADEQLTIELVNVPVENTDSIPELKITNQHGILINDSQTQMNSVLCYIMNFRR